MRVVDEILVLGEKIASHRQTRHRCSTQAAFEGQDLPHTRLAHNELESISMIDFVGVCVNGPDA